MGTESPSQKTSLPDSKKRTQKDVDKGWGVLVGLLPAFSAPKICAACKEIKGK
jgi:hypothetical protein